MRTLGFPSSARVLQIMFRLKATTLHHQRQPDLPIRVCSHHFRHYKYHLVPVLLKRFAQMNEQMVKYLDDFCGLSGGSAL